MMTDAENAAIARHKPVAAHASAIVRVKDEAGTLERTLLSLRRQTIVPETIVVDSGSTDGSLEIATPLCDRLFEIPPEEFSYGRALNIGARAASAEAHFALSAHCFPERDDWIERSLAHYERENVAATNGSDKLPDGRRLTRPFFQDAAHARSNPLWGFSNHAASWRASVWEEFPFDEQLDYAEDKEWAFRVLDAGWTIVFDPALAVDESHAWRGSARNFFTRQRRASAAISGFTELPYGPRDLAREWWAEADDGNRPAWFNRFVNYRRWAGLAGRYLGSRAGRNPSRDV
jgi:rhamnosyltransferase